MSFVLQPWQLLLVILAGCINRQQQQVIEYLRVENQVLKEKLGKKRILLTDDQRRRLAVQGKLLGRKMLEQVATVVTPDTILRWHRELIAQKWDYSHKRTKHPGRPPVAEEIQQLVLKLARENPAWGYERIQGALANLGHAISDISVGNILKGHGVPPAPERKRQTSWKTFLAAHWNQLASIDFTTIEVWSRSGLVTFYLLFVMELATRRVHFAGCTPSPDEAWMTQVARNLTDACDGFLLGKHLLLMDRDTKFCEAFSTMLAQERIVAMRLPPRSPNLNAHLERFMRSVKEECLSKLIFFNEGALRRSVLSYLDHYHCERNHQGLGNRLIRPSPGVGTIAGEIECHQRLGGMLKYYYRQAA